MSQPAARVSDMHTCPMVTPATPPVPHVGGPILPPGDPRTLIGGLPAARVGDMCTCVGPPDSIVKGSPTVMIAGRPAARMGDNTAHGGVIASGCPQVLIGNQGKGSGGAGAGLGATHAASQRAVLRSAAAGGHPFCEHCEQARRVAMQPTVRPQVKASMLRSAAAGGVPFCAECEAARTQAAAPPVPVAQDSGAQRRAMTDAAAGGDPFVTPH